jgi:hypothetical protein
MEGFLGIVGELDGETKSVRHLTCDLPIRSSTPQLEL